MKKIKLFDPVIDFKEYNDLKKILYSKFWASGAGIGYVAAFEKKFKKYVNSRSCVALSNGTAALHLALSLMDIKGKEVILPSLSFVSTAHAIVYNGGKPVFADVNPDTLCIDPISVRKAITKKTKVILPVHFAGMSCALDEISEICNEKNLSLVEDAAHAAGTTYKHKKIGSHGKAVCFSFHPVKNLAMPTGGAVTINDLESHRYEEILKSRRWCGISDRKGSKYDVTQLGWNYYMNEFSAAMGLTQLKKLDRLNHKRRQIAKRYHDEIKMDNKMPYDQECSYHFYWICVKSRDNFMKNMSSSNIETGIHYTPIHQMSFYRNKKIFPVTDRIGNEIVSLPIHPNLSSSEVSYIIRKVNQFA